MQVVALSGDGLPGWTKSDSMTSLRQLRPSHAVDATTNATTGKQLVIGCVDNGVGSQRCDVALEHVQQLVGPVRDWVPVASHFIDTILGHQVVAMGFWLKRCLRSPRPRVYPLQGDACRFGFRGNMARDNGSIVWRQWDRRDTRASVRHTTDAVCLVQLWCKRRLWLVREGGNCGTWTGVHGHSSAGRTRTGGGGRRFESVGDVTRHTVAGGGRLPGGGHRADGPTKRSPAFLHREPRVQLQHMMLHL